MTLVQSLVYAYVATLRVADLAVGMGMRYLAISGEDLYLLVHDKSCFLQWPIGKSISVLLAQARPAMINHHTSKCNYCRSLRCYSVLAT